MYTAIAPDVLKQDTLKAGKQGQLEQNVSDMKNMLGMLIFFFDGSSLLKFNA